MITANAWMWQLWFTVNWNEKLCGKLNWQFGKVSVVCFAALGTEPLVSHILGMYPTAELCSQLGTLVQNSTWLWCHNPTTASSTFTQMNWNQMSIHTPTNVHRYFLTILFKIAPTGKQARFFSTGKWKNKQWNIKIIQFYQVLKHKCAIKP